MAKHTIETTLTLEDKVFVNDKQEKIDYTEATVDIFGERLKVSFRKEDKSLLRVLRRDMQEVK